MPAPAAPGKHACKPAVNGVFSVVLKMFGALLHQYKGTDLDHSSGVDKPIGSQHYIVVTHLVDGKGSMVEMQGKREKGFPKGSCHF